MDSHLWLAQLARLRLRGWISTMACPIGLLEASSRSCDMTDLNPVSTQSYLRLRAEKLAVPSGSVSFVFWFESEQENFLTLPLHFFLHSPFLQNRYVLSIVQVRGSEFHPLPASFYPPFISFHCFYFFVPFFSSTRTRSLPALLAETMEKSTDQWGINVKRATS